MTNHATASEKSDIALNVRLAADALGAHDMFPIVQELLHDAADKIDRLRVGRLSSAADAYDAVAVLIRQGTPRDALLRIVEENAAELRKGETQ